MDVPAVTRNEYGDGAAVYVATPLFDRHYESAYHGHRHLLANVLDDVGDGRAYTVDAPAGVEVNAMRTDDATYLHFGNYHAGRPGAGLPQIDEVVPVTNVTATVRGDLAEATPVTDVRVETGPEDDGLGLTLDSVGFHEVVKLTWSEPIAGI